MPPANGEVLLENHPGTPFPGRSHGNCRKTKPVAPLSPGTTQGSSTAALGTAPAPGEAGNKCPPVIALPAVTGAAPGGPGAQRGEDWSCPSTTVAAASASTGSSSGCCKHPGRAGWHSRKAPGAPGCAGQGGCSSQGSSFKFKPILARGQRA